MQPEFRSNRRNAVASKREQAHIAVWVALLLSLHVSGAGLDPIVEVEEDVYSFTNANNGAGPMWCHGSTCLVRAGDRLFASGLDTVAEARPLNNCRWSLYERQAHGWRLLRRDEGRTREPSPLAAFHDGRVFLSANPTLGAGPEPNGGAARPMLFQFKAGDPSASPEPLLPGWLNAPKFTEHSYRSLAADGPGSELILFQNIGYTHAEWAFRNRAGQWSAQGQLEWPKDSNRDRPNPVRVCYPNVAIRQRAVYFCGVSDIVEPNPAWRDFKRQLTGKEWDYDFRRLFFTWTPDITGKPFASWIEIASRDQTCGWIMPGDLHVGSSGEVHLVWSERAIDERLRAKFFPEAKQSQSLNYAVVREGKVIRRQSLEESTEDRPGIVGAGGRFQVTPDQRLSVVYYASGKDRDGKSVSENRLVEIRSDGSAAAPVRIPFQTPFVSYFTATVRGGSAPSATLDLLGQRQGQANTISYARVLLR